MDYKAQLTEKLREIPGVIEEFYPNDDGGFLSFNFKGKDFAHFHKGNELDLRLTKKIIREQKLHHPKNSKTHPKRSINSPWIELLFESEADVEAIFRLIQLSIKQIS